MPTFFESLQLYSFCFPSHLGMNAHAIFNGQPRQLGMTKYVLHVWAIGSVLDIHKAIDVFPTCLIVHIFLTCGTTPLE